MNPISMTEQGRFAFALSPIIHFHCRVVCRKNASVGCQSSFDELVDFAHSRVIVSPTSAELLPASEGFAVASSHIFKVADCALAPSPFCKTFSG